MRYEEEPSIGMILDMYFPTGFMEEVTNISNDYVEKRRVLEPNLKIWDQTHIYAPFFVFHARHTIGNMIILGPITQSCMKWG